MNLYSCGVFVLQKARLLRFSDSLRAEKQNMGILATPVSPQLKAPGVVVSASPSGVRLESKG